MNDENAATTIAYQDLIKYPRTRHIEGSGLQRGDGDLSVEPWTAMRSRYLVVEEKVDGANVGISFGETGDLRLQCRGHYLLGGPNEAQFSLLKPWAQSHQTVLWDRLGDRYILFGEWLLAKHTVFYDALPHYFLEFDIYDKQTQTFLSTPARRALLDGSPVVSVPVVGEGVYARQKDLLRLVTPSCYKSPTWRENLRNAAELARVPNIEAAVTKETDSSDLMEGLYLKWEDAKTVQGRFKYVRRDFITAILNSQSHWRDRPLIKNALAPGADLYG